MPSEATQELRTIRRLATPVVTTQLGMMMLGVVDMLMLGHFSTEALSSAALARVWIMGTFIVVQGLLLGLDPFFSQAHGRRDTHALGLALQRGALLALLLSLPLSICWMWTGGFLSLTGAEADLVLQGGAYGMARVAGVPAFLLFVVLRGWLQGRGMMQPAMWCILGANLVNIVANWALVFGHLGFPALGVRGAGLATSLTQWGSLLTLATIVWVYRLDRGGWTGFCREALGGLGPILKQGLPIGMHLGIEVWAFQIATLMATPFGTEAIASHAIVLNLASISFMVPLGISIAVSARVGHLIGEGRRARAQTSAQVAMAMGVVVMIFFAGVLFFLRERLPVLYNANPRVLALTATLLPIAAAFQLFDGLQVVAAGVLRGMGRTAILPILHFVSFYGLGLPVAWWLAFRRGMGVEGVWWGLGLGLAVVSAALLIWLLRRGPGSRHFADHTPL